MNIKSLRQAAIVAAFVTAGTAPAISQAAPQCQNCGVVVSTHTYEREAERGSGVGGVGGAVVGGLLGNKIGNGGGRTLASHVLFPGYFFVHHPIDKAACVQILKARGVVRLLRGDDINWFGLFFTLSLVILCGIVGGSSGQYGRGGGAALPERGCGERGPDPGQRTRCHGQCFDTETHQHTGEFGIGRRFAAHSDLDAVLVRSRDHHGNGGGQRGLPRIVQRRQ